jgi:hypothetical protein
LGIGRELNVMDNVPALVGPPEPPELDVAAIEIGVLTGGESAGDDV